MEEKTNDLFRRIQAFADAGKDINRFYDDRAVLDSFLDSYYQHELCAVTEDAAFNKMLLPLNQRAYPIQEQLDWLLSHGANINDGGEDRPLMNAVSALDAPMTEYLLAHGADPMYDDPENEIIPYGCGNYYIDDLDIRLLDESFSRNKDPEVFKSALRIAVLLAQYGVTNVQTHCITIDGENRTVRIRQAEVRY